GCEIQIQIRMSLERLRSVLISLLVDSQMTGCTAVYSGNRLERLIVVQITQDHLIDTLRRIHEIEYGRIPEGNDDCSGIQRVQTRSKPSVIGKQRFAIFLKRIALSDVF